MKRTSLLTVLVIVSLLRVSFAQNPSNKIVIGTVDNIYSKVLKEKRTIWMYNPNEGRGSDDKKYKYPVLYLLDAEEHFHATVGMIKQLSGVWPNMIVVGITNTNRNRDFTLAPVGSSNTGNDRASGGGDNFMKFMEKELIPHVDSLYPTTSYRLISGHSLGGLAVVNALVNYTDMFNAYIAIDPSLWWDNQRFLKQAEGIVKSKKFEKKALFLGVANNMLSGMDTVRAQKDTTNYTVLYRSVTRFIQTLKTTGNNGLRWSSKFYPNESHGTVELNAQYDALRYLFNYYHFRTSRFTINPELNIDSVLVAHFKNVSEKLGYRVVPSEDLVNELGYACMGNKKMAKALTFFKLNAENYPKSANVFDSLGDYYVEVRDMKMARESFGKALSLQENADTRRKFEALNEKK